MELQDYFQSYQNYFWQWETDYDVPDAKGHAEQNLLSVPFHGAIAYRPLVEEILKALQPQGLPPFGALLLVIMASQENTALLNAGLDIIQRLPNNFRPGTEANIRNETSILTRIHGLDKQLKKGENRILLFQTLFAQAHNLHSAGSSDILLRKLAKRPYKLAACAEKQVRGNAIPQRDIGFLRLLGQKFPTTESIKEAMKGFSAAPEVAEEIAQEAVGTNEEKDFVQQLVAEPKTFAVGSLIKRIWSGLKIPMRHLSPGEQPIGGIADLINKGELHRMLLSEFANDEEVFLNRVANNEALYIQREIPPEENIFERVILIDGSLRNWGTPKILAFAVALAIVKHPKANTSCRVFILGGSHQEVMVETVDDVINSLNELSATLEVASAINSFFEAHKEQQLEAFLVTHEDCLLTEAMLKVTHEHRAQLKYLVSTSLEGNVNIFKQHNGTKKHIQKIILPLDELWANPPTRQNNAPTNASEDKVDLPKNYPLLFPAPKDSIAILYYEGVHYLLSTAKRLFKLHIHGSMHPAASYSYTTFKGAELLVDDISIKARGSFVLIKNSLDEFVLFQFQPDKHLISRLNLDTKEYADMNTLKLFTSTSFHIAPDRDCIYCYEDTFQTIFQFPVEGPMIDAEPTTLAFDISKKVAAYNTMLQKYNRNSGKFISNFHNLGINENQEFAFSKFSITYWKDSYILCGRSNSVLKHKTLRYENTFKFKEESEIITDARGMMTFKSADKRIPEFYIPANQHRMAIATEQDFGGDEYFLNQGSSLIKKPISEMYETYLQPFIQHILDHGTQD